MAPQLMRSARLERLRGGGKRKIPVLTAAAAPPTASVLLLLDILDDLGHVVLILTELGGILEQFLVFLFGFFERNRFLFLLDDVGLLCLDLGIELLGFDRLDLLLDRRDRAGATRFEKCLRFIGRAAFRADHGF